MKCDFSTKNIAKEAKPGQFVSVYSNDGSRLLPRPISICGIEGDTCALYTGQSEKAHRNLQQCTQDRSLKYRDRLATAMTFQRYQRNARLFVWAAVSGPPMLELAKQLDCEKSIVLGYRDELFLNDEFEAYGKVYLATEDGSAGTKGNVLDAVKACGIEGDILFACGPTPMLRAIKQYAKENGLECYLSLEEKMACGIGACLACVCKSTQVDDHSKVHNKRVCKEGPVFNAEEVEL